MSNPLVFQVRWTSTKDYPRYINGCQVTAYESQSVDQLLCSVHISAPSNNMAKFTVQRFDPHATGVVAKEVSRPSDWKRGPDYNKTI